MIPLTAEQRQGILERDAELARAKAAAYDAAQAVIAANERMRGYLLRLMAEHGISGTATLSADGTALIPQG